MRGTRIGDTKSSLWFVCGLFVDIQLYSIVINTSGVSEHYVSINLNLHICV